MTECFKSYSNMVDECVNYMIHLQDSDSRNKDRNFSDLLFDGFEIIEKIVDKVSPNDPKSETSNKIKKAYNEVVMRNYNKNS